MAPVDSPHATLAAMGLSDRRRRPARSRGGRPFALEPCDASALATDLALRNPSVTMSDNRNHKVGSIDLAQAFLQRRIRRCFEVLLHHRMEPTRQSRVSDDTAEFFQVLRRGWPRPGGPAALAGRRSTIICSRNPIMHATAALSRNDIGRRIRRRGGSRRRYSSRSFCSATRASHSKCGSVRNAFKRVPITPAGPHCVSPHLSMLLPGGALPSDLRRPQLKALFIALH